MRFLQPRLLLTAVTNINATKYRTFSRTWTLFSNIDKKVEKEAKAIDKAIKKDAKDLEKAIDKDVKKLLSDKCVVKKGGAGEGGAGGGGKKSEKDNREECPPLCDKVALVLGGAHGVGLQTTMKLLDNGVKAVTIADGNEEAGKQALQQIASDFGNSRAIFINCDLCKPELIDWAYKNTIRAFDRVDVVVNSGDCINDQCWEYCLASNVNGLLVSNLLALQYMSCQCMGYGGYVVNVASSTGLQPLSGLPVYSMSQAANINLTRALGEGCQVDRTGVRVIGIVATPVESPAMCESANNAINVHFARELKMEMKKAKLQQASDVADAIIQALECGKSGAIWLVARGDTPFRLKMPTLEDLKNFTENGLAKKDDGKASDEECKDTGKEKKDEKKKKDSGMAKKLQDCQSSIDKNKKNKKNKKDKKSKKSNKCKDMKEKNKKDSSKKSASDKDGTGKDKKKDDRDICGVKKKKDEDKKKDVCALMEDDGDKSDKKKKDVKGGTDAKKDKCVKPEDKKKAEKKDSRDGSAKLSDKCKKSQADKKTEEKKEAKKKDVCEEAKVCKDEGKKKEKKEAKKKDVCEDEGKKKEKKKETKKKDDDCEEEGKSKKKEETKVSDKCKMLKKQLDEERKKNKEKAANEDC